MKYIIKKLKADFIFDELEQIRKQFVNALTYTIESAKVNFDKQAYDPLDIYIEYDFQQKNAESVIYGFNLKEEIARNFGLDTNKYHSSKQLLNISKSLKELALEIDNRYQAISSRTLAETQDKKDNDYAKKVNRSYSQVLKDAIAQDEKLKREHAADQSKKTHDFLNAENNLNTRQDHNPSLKE